MAETLKDINAVINLGGVLTHWTGVSSSGGEITRYDKTPIGGTPAADIDENVREPISFEITTKVLGADAAAREAFIAKFARGTVFSGKNSPSGAGEFNVTGEDVDGYDYYVSNKPIAHTEKDNSILTVNLMEKGPTPVSP